MLNAVIHTRANTIDVDKRTVQFVISTETVDRHGTVFKMDGWMLDAYMRSPIVLYNHASYSSDPDNVIGTSRVWIEGGQLLGEATFETKDVNEKADKVFQKIKNGTLRAASVGVIPHEYRWGLKEKGEDTDILYFTRHELVEWSIVPAPSNTEAQVRAISDFKNNITKPTNDAPVIDPYRARAIYHSLIHAR